MRYKKGFMKAILAISLGIVILNGLSSYRNYIVQNEQQVMSVNYATEVSTENWEIKSHIVTSGNVSEDTIQKVCEIVKNDVQQEAWNFLCNSGGKLIIVEGNDIRQYVIENYDTDGKAEKVKSKIKGYCPYFYEWDTLQKVDIVIGADCLDSLSHEFYHAFDYIHGYSSSEEFQKLFENAETICRKIYPDDEIAIEYYSGQATEYFAEMASLYSDGLLNGVDEELEHYLEGVL